MSTQRRETRYTCSNDCCQEGCPGHTLELAYEGVSNTVRVFVDGWSRIVFDDCEFEALIRSQRALQADSGAPTVEVPVQPMAKLLFLVHRLKPFAFSQGLATLFQESYSVLKQHFKLPESPFFPELEPLLRDFTGEDPWVEVYTDDCTEGTLPCVVCRRQIDRSARRYVVPSAGPWNDKTGAYRCRKGNGCRVHE